MEKEKIIKEIKDIISHHENALYYSMFILNGKIEIDYDINCQNEEWKLGKN